MAKTFDDKLSSLREEDQYDEKRHAQWAEFQERVRDEENKGGEEMEEGDDDVVMAQVCVTCIPVLGYYCTEMSFSQRILNHFLPVYEAMRLCIAT